MGRLQSETISIRLTPEEKTALQERMYQAVAPSMRAFILDMCMNGEITQVCMQALKSSVERLYIVLQ